MARSGIYKGEVQRARDRLLAQGRYPSLDAVRIELGNTGSKTTISRYLKELEEEEGGKTGTKVAISEALQDLVGRLAARIHEEADARLAEQNTCHAAQIEALKHDATTSRHECTALRAQIESLQTDLRTVQKLLTIEVQKVRAGDTETSRLVQQVTDLDQLLAQASAHSRSLEEKHTHARDALEHFRQAAKEQRETEARQHEQQLSYLKGEHRTTQQALQAKQEECVRLARDNARISAELAHLATANSALQTQLHQAKHRINSLEHAEQRAEDTGRELVAVRLEQTLLTEHIAELTQRLEESEAGQRTQELELTALRANTTLLAELKAAMTPLNSSVTSTTTETAVAVAAPNRPRRK